MATWTMDMDNEKRYCLCFGLCILSILGCPLFSLSIHLQPSRRQQQATPTAARRSKQPQKTTSPCADRAARQSRGRVARGVTCTPAGERGIEEERGKGVDVSSYEGEPARARRAPEKNEQSSVRHTSCTCRSILVRARVHCARGLRGEKEKRKRSVGG